MEIKDRQIIRRSTKLRRLSEKISIYEKKGMNFSSAFNYKNKFSELSNELYRLVAQRLIKEDPTFKELATENTSLLKNSYLLFKTTVQQMSLTGTHATELRGRLSQNGHFYCSVKKTNLPIFNIFSPYAYTSEFIGKIDCLGNVILQKKATRHALFKRVPSKFYAEIKENGEVRLLTIDCDGDFLLTGGKNIISKIISEYSFTNLKVQSEFQRRKKQLEIIMDDYIQKITASKKPFLFSRSPLQLW